MLEFDNFKMELDKYKDALPELAASLNLERLKLKLDELERKQAEPGFWDDPDKSQKIVQEAGTMKRRLEEYGAMATAYEDAWALIEMGEEAEDASLAEEVGPQIQQFKAMYEKLKMSTLLVGEFDHNNAIVTLHPGAGGTEACDWTAMLYRMYTRWAEKAGYQVELLDFQEGDEAGIKSVTMQINGENAYGFLRSEKGVHRLVRISPFDAAGRRQTSFSSLELMPELDDSINIELNMDELRIDVFRSSGAGGQKVNKTSSAIRITHIPTGFVVQCQNERSQYQNKDKAMEMMKAKLYQYELEKQSEKFSDIKGTVMDNAFGSQIRSYVFHPYTLVKDLRTGEETGNIQAVMDGDLDRFMNAYLAWYANNTAADKQ
ncbi:MAG: peptide chain release factor 2 [Lachnospiraceae bacterium]|nr:peptide chain release factor 2 [Lachnospiraceae bacterium]